jgi:hypothetical protein
MDDEKYFTFLHNTLKGMDGFWTFFEFHSSRSTTKMTKQYFGPIWHRSIMQKNVGMVGAAKHQNSA